MGKCREIHCNTEFNGSECAEDARASATSRNPKRALSDVELQRGQGCTGELAAFDKLDKRGS
jgi:hypothetical protein